MTSANSPLVTICIANFNGEHMLADCINSVLAQDTETEIEIIVHDDASTDGSLDLLDSSYSNLSVIRSETNVGFCIANNRMVTRARGEYVLLLNNDAALAPDAIRRLLYEANAIGKPAILTLPQHDWDTGALVDRGCLLDPFYNPIPNLDPCRRDVAYVIGANLWIPRSSWNELGGFPEWLGSIAEDMYLCCVARLRGMPVRVTDASSYRHRQGSSFGGNRINGNRLESNWRRRALSERNKTAVMMVCTPGLLTWGLLPLHLAALSLEGLALALLKRDLRFWRRVYAPAALHAFVDSHFLLARRREVQATRSCSIRAYMSTFRWIPWKAVLLRRHGVPSIR